MQANGRDEQPVSRAWTTRRAGCGGVLSSRADSPAGQPWGSYYGPEMHTSRAQDEHQHAGVATCRAATRRRPDCPRLPNSAKP